MKLYDCATAPSPRRVRIFLAEKGIEVPTVQIDLRGGEHLKEPFVSLNDRCDVPFLELDDGTGIGEPEAICRYFEAEHPEPPLFGATAKEKAQVSMWNHRIEVEGLQAVAESLRNKSPGFKGRALTGKIGYEQIPELAERGKLRTENFFAMLDGLLAGQPFITGDNFTFADITAMVVVDFAGWLKIVPTDEQPHLKRWHDAVSARPSAKA